MRLLLDEMYPASIAAQLRTRGHDVVAVTERPELRSLPDDDLFDAAQRQGHAVVTENVADFSVIADRADQRGAAHVGLVLVDPAKHPRGHQRRIGQLVTRLDRLLGQYPGGEAGSRRIWL